MKITWLGQAGFLFETGGLKIIIDPYLSESCLKLNPDLYRRMPVDEKYLEIEPDVIIITHDHLDHYDPETLKHYLKNNGGITVLSPASVFEKIIKFGNKHNYVKFDRHTEWSIGDIRFSAVNAVHSDERAIGVIIESEGKKYYHTGDTLYNTKIFDDIPDDIFALFIVLSLFLIFQDPLFHHLFLFRKRRHGLLLTGGVGGLGFQLASNDARCGGDPY